MIPIVDCHQHLWDLSKFKLAWVKEGDPLAVSHTPKEYAEATKGLNVVKAVYMEVDVVEEQQQKEADYLIELIKSKTTPTVAAVVVRPAEQGGRVREVRRRSSRAARTSRAFARSSTPSTPRRVTRHQGVHRRHPASRRDRAELGHLRSARPTCGDAAKLVSECPGTRFILDHCGNAPILDAKKMEQWKKDMAKVAEHKNVVGKVSGIIASVKKGDWSVDQLAPAVNHTIEVFGWDRVMFGGDWPVCTLGAPLKDWVAAAKQIVKDRTEEQQRKLFHDNAVRFYGLSEGVIRHEG